MARGRRSPQLARLAAALVVAVSALGIGPGGGPPPVLAAADLSLVVATIYEVHPDEGRVAVTATVRATNNLSDTVTRRYFFEEALLSVLPGTSNFAVTAPSGSPSVAVSSRSETGTVLRISFGTRLAAGLSMDLTLTYDLLDPGGAPDRAVRISPSIVTFQAWASASDETPGSSVEVRIPQAYTTSIGRGPLTGPVEDAGGGWQIYSSGPLAAPLTFVADITADAPGEYVDGRRSATVGDETVFFVFRAWPDDPAWRDLVSELVLGSVPLLAADIGAPWPFGQPLTVTETLVRGEGGFEGAFDPEAGLVEIGYTAKPGVILHETAHAWFNGSLVAERWIAEAFAAYYAERAAATLGVELVSPGFAGVPAEAAFALNAWLPAGQATPEQDAYGSAASLALAREIAALVGDETLREVWAAAAAGAPAYQPSDASDESAGGPPALELGASPPDWRGLLDLLEAHAEADQAAALEGLWRRWVIRPTDAVALDARAAAREAYTAVIADAAPWTPPRQIREALRAWQFEAALELVDEAAATVRLRERVESAAAVAALTPPEALRLAFEGPEGLPVAQAEATIELATIVAIEAAAAARPASPSLVDVLGLIGVDPDVDLEASRSAFEAGDLDSSLLRAASARDAWEAAPAIGRGRIISSALLGLAVVLLAWLVLQRRRQGHRPRREDARPLDGAGR